MKKHNLLIIFGLVLLSICSFTYAQEYDFRQVKWGMSKEDVKEIEDRDIVYEDVGGTQELILYADQISKFDCFVSYLFVQDKLASAGYYINEEHTNKNTYIDDYEKLKELLSKKYGQPIKDNIIWKDDLYKDNKKDWGLAISIADLVYSSCWETPTTDIELILTGDNYKIELVIKYVSKELKEWAKEVVQEETLQNF
ncbi:MAG: hypothetical protein AB7E45_01890 [Candidatus Caldatribacteriota bacterium]